MTANSAAGTPLVTVADRPNGIRVFTLDSPPANAISFALAAEMVAATQAADADPTVRAVIVTGAGGKFSFGADIKDFATPLTPQIKTVQDVMAAIERSSKTYVAAIDGNALGGGFELALTCDYRVASKKTTLSFPELKLGLFPGAGGTQRLPRLIGAADTLQIMLKSETITAEDALKRGILDEVAPAGVVDAAVALIERVSAHTPKRRISARVVPAGAETNPFDAAQAHKAVPAEAKGGLAAHKLIDALADAVALPFAQGLVVERRLFDELVASPQSAALQHVFFAERQLSKIPHLSPATALDINTAGVVGAGTMGTGIAIAFASAGIPVVLVEPIAEQVERSKHMVAGAFASLVKRGSLTAERATTVESAISWASELQAVTQADLVIEAVFESMDVKKDVFAKLAHVCKAEALLASNTSTLNIDEMAEISGRPEQFVGLHFFAPANIMKLLEIVRGTKTSAQTLTTAVKLGKTLRKTAVVSANAFGFIGNRMFFDYTREALYLLEEGIAPERVDRVMKDFGFAMGPFATIDLSGVDVFWHIQQAQADALGERRTNIMDRLYESKRWGQKTGVGFYKYDGVNKREPIADPDLIALAADEAAKAGIAPRDVTDTEILERLTYALANAGANLLDTEIALRPGDEDIVYIYGYGFPRYHGGPMWYADEVGIGTVVARIKEFGWTVSPLLEKIAQSGGTIAGFQRELAHVS